jgi:hypothetical protein
MRSVWKIFPLSVFPASEILYLCIDVEQNTAICRPTCLWAPSAICAAYLARTELGQNAVIPFFFAHGTRESKLLECKRGRRPGGFVIEAQINDLCPEWDIPGYESLLGGSLPPRIDSELLCWWENKCGPFWGDAVDGVPVIDNGYGQKNSRGLFKSYGKSPTHLHQHYSN